MSAPDFTAIWQQAIQAATRAAKEENSRLPPEGRRGFDCGFAWVTIRPGRGPFVAWCKKNKKGQRGGYSGDGGYGFWYSDFSPETTQSISVHEAAARAFVGVLEGHGINASMSSRLD